MNAIEIRLDPKLVASLMDTIQPVLDSLKNELASPALLPEEDEDMEAFWKNDLLESQRSEIDIVSSLFGPSFMDTGSATVQVKDMDRMIRCCSAIRLKLRETVLGELTDPELEEGDFEGLDWPKERQLGYAVYALFASLQELIITQMGDDEEGNDKNPYM